MLWVPVYRTMLGGSSVWSRSGCNVVEHIVEGMNNADLWLHLLCTLLEIVHYIPLLYIVVVMFCNCNYCFVSVCPCAVSCSWCDPAGAASPASSTQPTDPHRLAAGGPPLVPNEPLLHNGV